MDHYGAVHTDGTDDVHVVVDTVARCVGVTMRVESVVAGSFVAHALSLTGNGE